MKLVAIAALALLAAQQPPPQQTAHDYLMAIAAAHEAEHACAFVALRVLSF